MKRRRTTRGGKPKLKSEVGISGGGIGEPCRKKGVIWHFFKLGGLEILNKLKRGELCIIYRLVRKKIRSLRKTEYVAYIQAETLPPFTYQITRRS